MPPAPPTALQHPGLALQWQIQDIDVRRNTLVLLP